jgi:hypothetical protein
MNKMLSLIAGGALLALASTAYAGQPLQLSERQMDRVTAGGVGLANAAALALGDALADTATQISTNVMTGSPSIAISQGVSQALAASLLFKAAAATHIDTMASLP